MKGNRRPQPPAGATSLPPESPTAKGTAKYTNKDGSKFITVTKPQPPGPPEPSPRTATTLSSKAQAGSVDTSAVSGPPRSINPKKAKRRAKAAAKARAEPGPAGSFNSVAGSAAAADQDRHQLESVRSDGDVASSSDDGEQAAQHHPADSGFTDPSKSKKSKKKKKKGNLGPAGDSVSGRNDGPSANLPLQRGSGPTREKIWNTTSQEERERIKAFWLGLGEDERKSLVKVEKDTVLKKMKEQQKHTCSCNVCGRKRNAIEEELEGLYDAYYEELEQYAHDPNHQGQAPPMMRPRRHLGSVGGMHSRATPSNYSGQQPSRGRIVDQVGEDDEDDGDEDYSDEDLEDEDDDYSEGDEEDIPPDEIHRDYAADFFNFGNSLTVQGRDLYPQLLAILKQFESLLSSPNPPSPEDTKRLLADFDQSLGGILTVADDLLKNDGRKFIEMMEQLAERRMAREEDTKEQYTRGVGYGHDANGVDYSHSHPPSEEEEYGPEDEDDEEFESQEEEYEEDDMTEEQRMEEGRRMFQIFAARMFEQRVLTAYREKVANQRQEKLLEELADEESQEFQRKAKKAKEAQKRKEKAAQKKQAQAEERARKEAEKAADEAQRQAEEARKAEEQRHKADEKRKKKEAQKKAEDEDRLRKEADRLRRIHEQKERQAEQERKTREAKEREKKDREEARLKEKEARERKEREARERREKQENDKREKEVRARANEAKEKHKQEARAAQKAALLANAAAAAPPAAAPITLSKRPAQHPSTIPALPQQPPTSFASPQVAVATPTLPMAPAPMRPRQPSGQEPVPVGSRAASQSGSGHSQNASPHPVTPIQASPGVIGPKGIAANQAATANAHLTSPLNATAKPATQQHSPFSGMPPMGLPFQMIPPVVPPPGFGPPAGHYAALGGGGYRAPGPPQAMSGPPGSNALGRPFSPMVPPPGFGQQPLEQLAGITPFGSLAKDVGAPASHSRQPSAGFDPAPAPPQTQPIARPAPIRRPGSVQHGQRQASETRKNESEDPHHLGSKALLDDSDPSVDGFSATRRPVAAARSAFAPGPASFSMDASAAFASQSPIWNNPPPPSVGHGLPFGHGPPPVGFHVGTGIPGPWGPPSNQAPFASHGNPTRLGLGRSGTVRHLLCLLCSDLSTAAGPGLDGFVPLEDLQAHVSRVTGEPVQDVELAALFETEGNSTNGGGTFEVRWEDSGKLSAVRWAQSTDPLFSRPRNPAEVGSPVVGSGDWGGPR